jgi:hypothetical protein
MAARASVTWTHCSVHYKVTSGVNHCVHKNASCIGADAFKRPRTLPNRTNATCSSLPPLPRIRADATKCPRCVHGDLERHVDPAHPADATKRPRKRNPSLLCRRSLLPCKRATSASPRTLEKKKFKKIGNCCRLEKRKKKISVFGFQSPRSPRSPSFAGEVARRRRFFWPSSSSHPSKLYSSLGWLNSKGPKPFFPFTLRLIDVDGF